MQCFEPDSGVFWIRMRILIRIQGLKKMSKILNNHDIIWLFSYFYNILSFNWLPLMRKSYNYDPDWDFWLDPDSIEYWSETLPWCSQQHFNLPMRVSMLGRGNSAGSMSILGLLAGLLTTSSTTWCCCCCWLWWWWWWWLWLTPLVLIIRSEIFPDSVVWPSNTLYLVS